MILNVIYLKKTMIQNIKLMLVIAKLGIDVSTFQNVYTVYIILYVYTI